MCVIVDTNVASKVFSGPPNKDFAPLLKWLNCQSGCLIYGGTLEAELRKVESVRRFIVRLSQVGRAILVPEDEVTNEQIAVDSLSLCQSNDSHIIALARVSGARTLCSHDAALHTDFKNPKLISKPRGSVYQNAAHVKLLRHTKSCPRHKQK